MSCGKAAPVACQSSAMPLSLCQLPSVPPLCLQNTSSTLLCPLELCHSNLVVLAVPFCSWGVNSSVFCVLWVVAHPLKNWCRWRWCLLETITIKVLYTLPLCLPKLVVVYIMNSSVPWNQSFIAFPLLLRRKKSYIFLILCYIPQRLQWICWKTEGFCSKGIPCLLTGGPELEELLRAQWWLCPVMSTVKVF